MTRTLAYLAALLLCAAGCGDNNDGRARHGATDNRTAEETTAVKRLEKFFSENGYETTPHIPRCIATGLVNEVGIERLQSGNALTKNLRVRYEWHLPRDDANTMADVWLRCENYKLYAARVVADPPDLKDAYVRRCIREVTEADVREFIVTVYSGPIDESDFSAGLPKLFKMYRKFERAGCGFEGD